MPAALSSAMIENGQHTVNATSSAKRIIFEDRTKYVTVAGSTMTNEAIQILKPHVTINGTKSSG